MAGRRQRLSEFAHTVYGGLRSVGRAVVRPLVAEPDGAMSLSIPEAQTTTVDGDTGWGARPPALLGCPNCGGEIYQERSLDVISCSTCRSDFRPGEFPELELLAFECPVCGGGMTHGRRHPEQFDVPEWASCEHCQYHWEFEHF